MSYDKFYFKYYSLFSFYGAVVSLVHFIICHVYVFLFHVMLVSATILLFQCWYLLFYLLAACNNGIELFIYFIYNLICFNYIDEKYNIQRYYRFGMLHVYARLCSYVETTI